MFGAGAIARSAGHKARYYRLYRDLIADSELDAVIIATPDFSHHGIMLESLQAGKHVYVEQPLCLTWQQGVELVRAEHKSSRVVQVGSQRRSNSVYLETAKAVTSGAFGTPGNARVNRTSNSLGAGVLRRGGVKLPEPLNFFDWQANLDVKLPLSVDRFLNWRYYPEYGGGVVTDMGTHVLDGVHLLTGTGYPVSVRASGVDSGIAGFSTTEKADIAVEYAGGRAVKLSLNAVSDAHGEMTTLDGTNGRCEITPIASSLWKTRGSSPVWQQRSRNASGLATRAHLENFFGAIRGKEAVRAPVRDTFAATLVCQMANLSIRSGRAAHWNATEEKVEI